MAGEAGDRHRKVHSHGGWGTSTWGEAPITNRRPWLDRSTPIRSCAGINTFINRMLRQQTIISARLLAERNSINRARAEIQEQLRDNPSTRDITDGNALNLLLDTLTNPSNGGSSTGRITTPLRHELISEIPFAFASEGFTICLDQMTMNDSWPLALRVDDFKPEREQLRKTVQVALDEDKKGNLEPATIEAVQAAIDQLRLKFQKLVLPTNPDYIPAHDTIKAIAGLTKMLYSPKMEEILAELEDYQGTTLGDLLSFMQAFNLRFAPANSFRQRRLYLKLYAMLSQQANGSMGNSDAVAPPQSAEAVGGQALGTAESLGGKAVAGLKSAAVDFFKDMDWKHLSGTDKSAPPH